MVPASDTALKFSGSSTGGMKLAVQVVRFLLTDRGSSVFNRNYGGGVMALLGTVDPSTLGTTIALIIQEAQDWMRANTAANVDSEALQQIILNGYEYDGSTLYISFTVLNRAGEQVSITLPVTS
jgi:hypothetical protein